MEECHPQRHPGVAGGWDSRDRPAAPLPTLRNLCSRKANQFVSIFSATDSVLGEAGGHKHHTRSPPNRTCPGGSGMSPALSLSRRQPPPRCPPVPALPGLPTASLVTLSSSHVAQITAWLSKSLGFTAAPGNQGQPSDNGSEIAAFSPVPPSVLSPHCARDYL